MAMIQTSLNLIWRFLPLTMSADGSITMTITEGYMNAQSEFVPITQMSYVMPPEYVSTMMAAQPTSGLSRYEDITTELCQYVISNNYASGSIIPG